MRDAEAQSYSMYALFSRLRKVYDGRGEGERRHHRPEGCCEQRPIRVLFEEVNARESDQIRITAFTTEGDPVLYDVKYEGKSYHYTSDSSRDHSVRQTMIVKTKSVSNSSEKEQSVYTLRQCAEGEDHELLRLPKQ